MTRGGLLVVGITDDKSQETTSHHLFSLNSHLQHQAVPLLQVHREQRRGQVSAEGPRTEKDPAGNRRYSVFVCVFACTAFGSWEERHAWGPGIWSREIGLILCIRNHVRLLEVSVMAGGKPLIWFGMVVCLHAVWGWCQQPVTVHLNPNRSSVPKHKNRKQGLVEWVRFRGVNQFEYGKKIMWFLNHFCCSKIDFFFCLFFVFFFFYRNLNRIGAQKLEKNQEKSILFQPY